MHKRVLVPFLSAALLLGVSTPVFTANADELSQKSEATFSVDAKTNPTNPEDGNITLSSVPSFDFGPVKTSEIYSGFSNKKAASVTNSVQIKDYRSSAASGWTLQASRNEFTGLADKSSTLSFTSDQSSVGSATVGGSITSDGSIATLGSAGTGYHGIFNMSVQAQNSSLTSGANPQAKISDGDKLTSDITWNLVGSSPEADELG